MPIDSSNFDNAAVTTAVPYTGAPAIAGHLDGITVPGLYIENGYYFAVKAVDLAGSLSSILASSPGTTCDCLNGNCCAAHFLSTTLTGTAGIAWAATWTATAISASPPGGRSARTVSAFARCWPRRDTVFIYFGTGAGYAAAPSVTFTGTATQFGSAIADIGDIDGDLLDDIAIAARNDGGIGKVYIFSRKNPPASWGTTNAWPATLTDTQANYVMTGTAPLTAGSMDVRNLARLGNFDGVGPDDFAVAFDGANGVAGSVFIVKGSNTFASINLPDAANAYEIDGAAANSGFGAFLLGLGSFYDCPGLVSTATLTSAVYAFGGQALAAPITAASADDSAVTATAARYGSSLGLLGPIGTSTDAITIGALGSQYVDVNFGTAATGPIVGTAGGAPTPSVRLTPPQETRLVSSTSERLCVEPGRSPRSSAPRRRSLCRTWFLPGNQRTECRSTSSTAQRWRRCRGRWTSRPRRTRPQSSS